MNNKIPRKFNEIVIKTKIKTSSGKIGEIFNIVKNEYGEYIGTKTNTGEKYSFFLSMLRDANLIEVLKINK